MPDLRDVFELAKRVYKGLGHSYGLILNRSLGFQYFREPPSSNGRVFKIDEIGGKPILYFISEGEGAVRVCGEILEKDFFDPDPKLLEEAVVYIEEYAGRDSPDLPLVKTGYREIVFTRGDAPNRIAVYRVLEGLEESEIEKAIRESLTKSGCRGDLFGVKFTSIE